MELRAFGNADMKVSPLGFGVMRLPMKDGGKTVNSNTIDQVDVDTSIAVSYTHLTLPTNSRV